MTSLDNLGGVHVPQFNPTNTTLTEGLRVAIYLYFLTICLPGYKGWEITDFISYLNGMGMNLFPSNLVTSLTISSSGLEI